MLYRRGMALWLACIMVCALMVGGMVPALAKEKDGKPTKEEQYALAQTWLEEDSLFEALDAFTALKAFEDSKQYTAYTKARIMVQSMNYVEAYDAFVALGDFLDSQAFAVALADMVFVPFTDSGALAALEAEGAEVKADSIETFMKNASQYQADYNTFRYGLMDTKGNQKTALTWPWVGRLVTTLGMYESPADETLTLNLDTANGRISPNNVAAYLIYDGSLNTDEYSYPQPPEGASENAWSFGLINAQGEVLVQPEYGHLLWSSFGMAAFAAPGDNSSLFLFNLKEDTLPVQPLGQWDKALYPWEDSPLFAVCKGDVWQYIARDGTPVGDSYQEIRAMQGGYGAVKKDDKWGFVNSEGTLVVPCTYAEVSDSWQELAAVQEDAAWRYIRMDGQPAFEGSYAEADEFRVNRARVQAENGLYGFIDETGEMVIDPIYEDVDRFTQDVKLACVQANGKWGAIDVNGTEMIKPKYSLLNGFFSVGGNSLSILEEKGKYGIIDRKGKVLAKAKWPRLWVTPAMQLMARENNNMVSLVGSNGKTLVSHKPNTKHTAQVYTNGASVLWLNYNYSSYFMAEYFDTKGKRIKLTLNPALEGVGEEAAGAPIAMEPRPVSADAPRWDALHSCIAGGDSIQDISLYPFLPDKTIADLEQGALPGDWATRLTWEEVEIADPNMQDPAGLKVKDSLSGLTVLYVEPLYDLYGSDAIVGFKTRSLLFEDQKVYYNVRSSDYFPESRYNGDTYYRIPVDIGQGPNSISNPASFYRALLEAISAEKQEEALTSIFEPIARPILDFEAAELAAGRRYSLAGNLVITEGTSWKEIVLFPFSNTYTQGDFDEKATDGDGWAERLTTEGLRMDDFELPLTYTDSKTGVKLVYCWGDAQEYDVDCDGYSEITIMLPNGKQYEISGITKWYPEAAALFDEGQCFGQREAGNARKTYYPPRAFYAALLADVEALGADAAPLCQAIQARLTLAEEALAASGQEEPAPIVHEFSASAQSAEGWVSVTDDWLAASAGDVTWEDIRAIPVSTHTLGEIVLASARAQSSSWYRRLYFDPEVNITMEEGQPTELYLNCDEWAYLFLYDPLRNDQGAIIGYATANLTSPSGIEFYIDGTSGEVVYTMDEKPVSKADFYALLWNSLLHGENPQPLLEAVQAVYPAP